jgi:hypothetical protein
MGRSILYPYANEESRDANRRIENG